MLWMQYDLMLFKISMNYVVVHLLSYFINVDKWIVLFDETIELYLNVSISLSTQYADLT